MRDRATVKAKEILAGHHPDPLPTDVAAELSAIVARCEESRRRGRVSELSRP